MITGNKGEWSEIYALFKLLGDKELTLGDNGIEKVHHAFFPIIKILRSGTNGDFEFSIHDEIVFILGKKETLRVPVKVFKQKAIYLLEKIKENKERTFSIPIIEEFMLSINCVSIKADSSTKTDITIVVHDQITNQQPKLGFSIKSQLGSPSTLLNAGKTTNFIYKIEEKLSKNELDKINSLVIKRGNKYSADIKSRVLYILNNEYKLSFKKVENQIFSNNLILIDSLLPKILSNIILDYYSTEYSHLSDLVELTANKNPQNFDIDNKHKFYDYKIKRFLTDIALGMMPSKVWTGKYDATGGYLIVKQNGDVLCYHLYNRNEFENYLLNNTKLETASSTRHGFGEVYKENNSLFFKLNLQIRFIK